MNIILGLGNIGPTYAGTRHNIGFTILDSLTNNEEWLKKDKFKATICETIINNEKVILVKPNTYYNLSGESLQAIKQFYKIENKDILIVHDELALPFGTIRTRLGGSDAGNNGIKSIIANCGADIMRTRIGISNQYSAKADSASFVLSRFSHDENTKLNSDIIPRVASLITEFVNDSLDQTTYTLDILDQTTYTS